MIYEIVKGLVEEYKMYTKMQLSHSHEIYIGKLKEELDLEGIKIIINNDIDLEFSELLNVLKKNSKY